MNMNAQLQNEIKNFTNTNYDDRHSNFHHVSKIDVIENKFKYRGMNNIKYSKFYPNSEIKKILKDNGIKNLSKPRHVLIRKLFSF